MIHFVTTRAHGYTIENLVRRQGARRCRSWSYEELYALDSIPAGTWVFTDHERLSPLQVRHAARIARRLQDGGSRVLNHPARVRTRIEILRRLQEAGINDFAAYPADSEPRPARFPVFIRNSYDHDARRLVLIDDQESLDAELQLLEEGGEPLIGKLVIEYLGEEFLAGVWRRFSTYSVAGALVNHHVGFDDRWIVKDGFGSELLEEHPGRDQMLALEREFVTRGHYSEILAEAFAIARIDYGRADFSLFRDRVQIFEINTNPNHGDEEEVLATIHPRRRPVQQQSEDELHRLIGDLGRRSPLQRMARSLGITRKSVALR